MFANVFLNTNNVKKMMIVHAVFGKLRVCGEEPFFRILLHFIKSDDVSQCTESVNIHRVIQKV